jgi:small subunit ribosomal protein S21|tara:strand:+ start:167 stop:427 length:261 start_codon:yes stop_codon:yes gene_type:complete
MQDNRQKKPYKKIRREDMEVPGCFTAVKVVNGNIELALKAFKRKIKDSGKIEELKDRKEYIKPSAVKRKKMQQAVRAEYRRRMLEN